MLMHPGGHRAGVDEALPALARCGYRAAQGPASADHREQGVDVGADIDLRVQDLHGDLPTALRRCAGASGCGSIIGGLPACASRVSVSNKSPLTRMCNLDSDQAHRLMAARASIEECDSQAGSTR